MCEDRLSWQTGLLLGRNVERIRGDKLAGRVPDLAAGLALLGLPLAGYLIPLGATRLMMWVMDGFVLTQKK
jgi:hypothetical protein